jgi:hypothetical protein
MKTTAHLKVGMRYVILMVLVMTLTIVAKPTKAFAIPPCIAACINAENTCRGTCRQESKCLDACMEQAAECADACITGM